MSTTRNPIGHRPLRAGTCNSLCCIVACTLAVAAFAACGGHRSPTQPSVISTLLPERIALVNGTLIDGTGARPVADAVLVIDGGRIVAAGPRGNVTVPSAARVIDVLGAAILPGFINAHVHDAYNAARLETWAQAGVTTVRDMEILTVGRGVLATMLSRRAGELRGPLNARLVVVGYILAPPGGYGRLPVATPEEARNAVEEEVGFGVDAIKFSIETGYGPLVNLPLLSADQIAAIVDAAHARGRRVTVHVTNPKFLQQAVEAGADEAAHMPPGWIPGGVLVDMAARDFIVVPTLKVMEAYGGLDGAMQNLSRFMAVRGQVALGNDYAAQPAYGAPPLELGMPISEIGLMRDAGMSPMDIIVAATRNGARACGLERELGTLQAGMIADVLVVDGDPLTDLSALLRVRLVVHDGVLIRSPPA
jgi:imidazolonepropionase-like amidohydrolase